LAVRSGVDLPDYGDELLNWGGLSERIKPQFEAYGELGPRISTVREKETYHHLLGQPQLIQGDMRDECQLASSDGYVGSAEGYDSDRAKELRAGARDWLLLLQLDSEDQAPGWMWGDVGRLYFWIRVQDLRARKFERVWMVLQCY